MNNYYGTDFQQEQSVRANSLSQALVKPFLQRVFMIMGGGLAITGLISYWFAGWLNAGGLEYFAGNQILFWGLMLAPLAFVMVLSFGINKLSTMAATLIYVAYAIVNGMSLSFIFLIYTTGSVAATFFVTAGMFIAMGIFGIITKADLSKFRNILYMGVIGLIIATLVNYFLQSGTFDLIISFIGVVIFCGIAAYKIQDLTKMQADEDTPQHYKMALMGALSLYITFINLFLFLLRFMGNRR